MAEGETFHDCSLEDVVDLRARNEQVDVESWNVDELKSF